MKIHQILGYCLIVFFFISCKKEISNEILTEQEQQEIILLEQISKQNPINALIKCDSILSNSQSVNFKAKVTFYKAEAYRTNNDYNGALKYYVLALNHFKKIDDFAFQIKTLNGMSFANTLKENYVTAANLANESLKIAEKKELKKLIASSHNVISFIHYSNSNYKKAIYHVLKTEKIHSEQTDVIALSSMYNNLIILYTKLNDFDNALKFNEKLLELIKKNNLTEVEGKFYNNTGGLYQSFGENEKAIINYKKAIEVNRQSEKNSSIPNQNIADIQFENGKNTLAKKNYLLALQIDEKISNLPRIAMALKGLVNVCESNNDYKNAIGYQRKFDSVNQYINKNKADENIRMLENQNKLKESKQLIENKNREVKNTRLIIITLIILFLFITLYSIQRLKAIKLKNEKNKILLEQKVLRSQMNPHFIFNALSAIQNSLLDNEPIKSASYLSKFAKLIRQNFDFIDKKSIFLHEEIDALKNYISTQKLRFNDKFNCDFNIADNIDVNVVKIPPLLLQPFVENSIEHGFKNKHDKGKISINISAKPHYICYEIIDNGNGFNTAIKDKKLHSFNVFIKRLQLLGREDEKTVKVNSSDKGTSIKFCLKQ